MARKVNYQRSHKAPPVSLIDYLSANFIYNTREKWIDIIENKHWVSLDGKLCKDPDALLGHQVAISFDVPEELEPEVDERMELLHLDPDIIVVSKSGNIPVGVGGRYSKRTLVNIAPRVFRKELEKCPATTTTSTVAAASEQKETAAAAVGTDDFAPFLAVHRLDKETSGIVVMARTAAAAAGLSKQFARCAEEISSNNSNNNSATATTNDKAEDEEERKQKKAMMASHQKGSSSRCLPERRSRDDGEDGDTTASAVVAAVVGGVVKKEYFAVVEGHLDRELDIRLRIGPESDLPAVGLGQGIPIAERTLAKMRVACAPENEVKFGREARTVVTPVAYSVVAPPAFASRCCQLTACRVRLYTGRTHQIRIHCAAMGFPLVGDKLYVAGGGTVDCDTYLKRTRGEVPVYLSSIDGDSGSDQQQQRFVVHRHLLHAASLEFVHPFACHHGGDDDDSPRSSRKVMRFESNPWSSFVEACPVLAYLFPQQLAKS